MPDWVDEFFKVFMNDTVFDSSNFKIVNYGLVILFGIVCFAILYD